jgi:catechol 2,3-dioxygenase-like lactoylglutathione lyase family enzyme
LIIDHIGISVSNVDESKAFFSAALAPLGISLTMETHGWVGLGREGKPEFWFGVGSEVQRPMHLAFRARSREQVQQFHAAAIAAGAKDNGPPGLRPQYHANYYGAFVIGPDGHNVEAVCHDAEVV